MEDTDEELDDNRDIEVNPPTFEDLWKVLEDKKNNKAPGSNEIQSELMKHGGEELLQQIYSWI